MVKIEWDKKYEVGNFEIDSDTVDKKLADYLADF